MQKLVRQRVREERADGLAGDCVFDERRLAALERAGIFDSGPDEQFDELTRLAATLLDAPVSALTIVSHDRTWAKSVVGMHNATADCHNN